MTGCSCASKHRAHAAFLSSGLGMLLQKHVCYLFVVASSGSTTQNVTHASPSG